MIFSAATEPGTYDSPNEDWVGISSEAAIILDGVTVFKGVKTGCMHGTPWYVNQLGTRLLVAAADQAVSLRSALRSAVSSVAELHAGVCDLDQVGAPSAAVAMMRKNDRHIEYLVLADMTILLESADGITVVTDERVNDLVDDLAGENDPNDAVMKRREHYRNKEGGYWVAAADPEVAEHAKTGEVPLSRLTCVSMMSDGVSRLVTPFGQTDWPGVIAMARAAGPAAVIQQVRKTEATDTERTHWPRFKASDDATITLIIL